MSSLLAELQAGGTVEARGGFTIDSDKAREKLRHYQLADPHRYVLLLVEAAVSCGAARLEFEIDSDDLHLRFEGAVFRFEQLENFYASLFVGTGSEFEPAALERLRGLQHLALALNSAMALNPRFARIVSVAADGTGARLELRPDAPDQVEHIAASENRPPGNWIHVKERFRPGLLLEFLRGIGGKLDEVLLLRERCRWARTPIVVNGQLISGPVEFEQEQWTVIDVFDPPPQCIGRAALGHGEAGARAQLLANGVLIEEVEVLGCMRGFQAIVDSPRFGKDVSQTKLLRDSGYDAVMRAIQAAHDQTIARLAERCAAQTGPGWGPALLRTWLGAGQFGGLRRALREHEVFALVAEVPLWPTLGRGPVSTRALIEGEGPVRYAWGYDAGEFDQFLPTEVPYVLALESGGGPSGVLFSTVAKLFESRLHDHTAAVRDELRRHRARLEFLRRKQAPKLGDDYYLIRETIVGSPGDSAGSSSIRGELGLRAPTPRGSWITLLQGGCVLQEFQLEGVVAGLTVIVEGPLTPNSSYDAAKPDAALAALVVAVLAALNRLITRLATLALAQTERRDLDDLLRRYLYQVADPDYARAILGQFGFGRSHARLALEGLLASEHGEILPVLGLEAAAGLCHPLAKLPLYQRVQGKPLSLVDLQLRRDQGQGLAWLEAGTAPMVVLETEVLLLSPDDRAYLSALFGAEALEPFAGALARLRQRQAFLARPQAALELAQPSLVRVGLGAGAKHGANHGAKHGAIRGQLGLREFGYAELGEGVTPVRVFVHERELSEERIELPLPGLLAWVEGEEFEVNAGFDGLARPVELRPLVLDGLVALVALQLSRAQLKPQALRRCEWWWLAMVPAVVLGAGGLAAGFAQLFAARGPGQAIAELDGLLALLERLPERDLERALGRLRGRDELPTAAAVDAQIRRPSRRPTDAELERTSLRRKLGEQLGALLELPLFRQFRGPPVGRATAREHSLAQLLQRIAGGQPIPWVSEELRLDAMPKLDFAILALDPVEQQQLQGLLGAPALEQVDQWLRGRAEFERRRTIDEVRVPRGAVLTTLEVAGPGWRGQLGINRERPRDVQRSKIRLFTAKREAAVLDLPGQPLALVGALEFDQLELNERFDDLTGGERERVRAIVQAQADALIRDLVGRFAGFDRADKARAAELVRHLLTTWPPGRGGYAARARQQPALFKLLAELPVFAGARKPWSAAELAGARTPGGVATIAYRKSIELPDLPTVVLDGDDVQSTLHELFGGTRDLYAELARDRALAARKAAAPVLPSAAPAAALATVEIDQERLRGLLWISPGPLDPMQVMFGEGGRVISARSVAAYCACAGAIWGPGLDISADWTRVVIPRPQARMLERQAVELWDGLLSEFLRQSELGVARAKPERARFNSMRDSLRGLFLRLHAGLGQARDRRGPTRRHQRGNRFERLYVRVWAAPLLELSSRRWISAELAARERPIELAELGLWTGPSAEELAHRREVERREVERQRDQRRAAERAAQREAERATERRQRAQREAERQAEAARERLELERQREAERRRSEQRAAAQARERQREAASKAPKPPPQPVASPEQLLLEAVREELRLVRASNRGLVSNRHLEALSVGEPVRRGPLFRQAGATIQVDGGHPLFLAALAGYLEDPALLTLLASATYTYLNIVYVEIADADEAEFLRLHAAHAASGGFPGSPGARAAG